MISLSTRVLIQLRTFVCLSFVSLLLIGVSTRPVEGQGLGGFDRDSALSMLSQLKSDIKDNYYDPTFRGIDLDQHFSDGGQLMRQAKSRDELMAIIAQLLMDFNDSHTFFLPPSRSARIQYGWQMQMIGDNAYITQVKPGSDAELKGLKRGDLILSVDGFKPARDSLWKMLYRYYAVMPTNSIRLVVQSPDDPKPRQLDVLSKIRQGAAVVSYQELFIRYLSSEGDLYDDRFYEVGNEMIVWNMPTFAVSENHIDDIMRKARKFKTLVLDLRDNGGGYQTTLERLTGYFFDRDLKIADLKGRKEFKPILAKTRKENAFTGKLIVLIDNGSGSASELFARTIQLEKRGTILGDRSAGAVMRARQYDHQTGVGRVLYFGSSVTNADIIMPDGKSLENVGVVPDEQLLPSGKEMAEQGDPVLARAAALAGVELDAKKAGTLFPFKWAKN